MAKGTDFGGVHSSTTLNLIQQKVEIPPAEPKLNLIDIPGANGSVDLTEALGVGVVFKDRKIKWTFALYPGADWEAKKQEVSGALNGRSCHITLDSDPGYYYDGRVSVSNHKLDGQLKQITVTATCRPYKLKQQETTVTQGLTTSEKTITLTNDRKPVVPEITVTAETVIQWNGNSYTLSAGTHELLDIVLQEGSNTLKAKVSSGTGSITITYQEGAL